MFTSDAVSNLFIAACSAAIHVSTYINARFRYILDSESAIAALFELAAFTFCSGLLDVVRSAAPPPLSWFKSLPLDIPINTWGIYAIVLEMPGYDPLLYIGSGTASSRGVRVRIADHHAHKLSAVNVAKALEFGYTIQHIALLAYCNIPSAADRPKIRTVVVALEAVFTALFWAFAPGKDDTGNFGLGHMCPWAQDSFEWLGLCTHSSLREEIKGLDGEMDFTSEELEAIEQAVKGKNRQYQAVYQKALRTNPTEKFKQQQKAKNDKHKPTVQENQRAAVRDKKHYCEPCDVSCRNGADLRRHNTRKGHLLKLEYPDGFICRCCDDIEFQYFSDLQQHFKSQRHQTNSAR